MRPLLRVAAPSRQNPSRNRLIVAEEGACSVDAHLYPDIADDETTVIAQGADEQVIGLPFRVVRRLTIVECAGRRVEQAAILIGPKRDRQAAAARELVLRSLLAHMATASAGELVLVAHRAEADLRHELLALVETLLNDYDKTPVTLRLRFLNDGPPPASGVYPRPPRDLAPVAPTRVTSA